MDLALAVDVLSDSDVHSVGPALKGLSGAPISILGAGTGFGVSCLVRDSDRLVPIATEGGHIGFAPSDGQELALLHHLWKQFERVSVERILSDPGLETLYRSLEYLAGREVVALSAAQIAEKAALGAARARIVLRRRNMTTPSER